MRVSNRHASSNRNCSLPNTYRKHEREKKNACERRILEVEHSSFTPLIFSATGGMTNSTRVFYQRLASLLANKWGNSYGPTMSWLNCRLVFSLLRSAIRCTRGARSSPGHPIRSSPITLVNSEADISIDYSCWTFSYPFLLISFKYLACIYLSKIVFLFLLVSCFASLVWYSLLIHLVCALCCAGNDCSSKRKRASCSSPRLLQDCQKLLIELHGTITKLKC